MRIFKQVLAVAALAACFVALPKGWAEPREGWHLEARVPANTLALLTLEDVHEWEARFNKTAIAALGREPEMKAFVDPIIKSFNEMMESEEKSPFGEETALIKEALEQLAGLRGQVAVALLDIDPSEGTPHAVGSLDFGDHLDDFKTFVERMRQHFDADEGMVTTYEKDGRTWWQMQEGMPVTATTVDTAFVLATDAALLEGVIGGETEDGLHSSGTFNTVRRKAGGGDLALFAYANVPAIVETFDSQMDDEGRRIANALGLDTVKAAAYGMSFRGDGFMDSMILHAPEADHGLATLMRMPPFEPRALKLVPSQAFWYEEASCNFSELLPNIKRIAGAIDVDMVTQIDDWMRKMSDTVGVDLEQDILGGLAGGAAGYMTMPETGGLYPELAMMLQVKDATTFEQRFAAFTRGLAGAVSEEGHVIASTRALEYRGHNLHLFEMQAARGDDPIPFTPTWTLMNDWLVITLVPHAMKEIVLRSEDPTAGPGLAGEEDFRSLQDVLPKGAGAMSYFDFQAVMNLVYDTAVPVLQTVVKPNVMGKEMPFTLDWAQLPAARTVRPYFRSMGVFTTSNDEGISMQMHGPLPLMGMWAATAAVAVPFLMVSGTSRSMAIAQPQRRLGVPMPATPGVPTLRVPGPAAGMSADQRLAMAKARELSSYVRAFLLAEKRLPKSLQELEDTNVLPSLPTDPWGNAYKLKVVEAKSNRFQILSGGPDGKIGTADDVRSGP